MGGGKQAQKRKTKRSSKLSISPFWAQRLSTKIKSPKPRYKEVYNDYDSTWKPRMMLTTYKTVLPLTGEAKYKIRAIIKIV